MLYAAHKTVRQCTTDCSLSNIDGIGLWDTGEAVMAVTHSRRKTESAATVASKRSRDFDLKHFLTTIGEGWTIVSIPKKQTIYAQGASCDAVFYVQKGSLTMAGAGWRFIVHF
jgi:hypothetical protein